MSVLGLLAVIGCIGWKAGSQWRGSTVNLKNMAQLPAASAAITGWLIFHGHSLQAISGTTWRFLALQATVAVVLGAVRGPGVALSEKNGCLALRYRAMPVVLWIVLGAIGVTLAELAVVVPRAMASPIPFAPATNGSGESTALAGYHARPGQRRRTS